jgi:hypothetical protein
MKPWVCGVICGAIASASAIVGCGGDDGGAGIDAAANLSAKQFCVSETNRYRAMNQKPALAENTALETYADTGANVDYTSSSPHSHFTSTSGGGIASAENECPGHSGWHLSSGGDMNMLVGQCVAAFYAEGPGSDYSTHGHYINMMGPYTKLGCGIYEAANGDVTIVQDYGN